ncbi:aldose epimerase family protein [Aquimarina agarivorans]|uniref:aldose epimerase family protein n=1 Tax=Aquimarina agarivorans TaxID=980584 RepID=UPI000248E94E|nr:aldose epimerase family protein [Aquimarina agarivorans]
MNFKQLTFGNYKGAPVEKFILTNVNGMEVHVMNFGATITSIKVPDLKEGFKEITCGFDTFQSYFSEVYLNNAPYFGGTIGRYCSQIKDAYFYLNGEHFNIAQNCDDNNLHGGNVGYDKRMWLAQPYSTPEGTSVKMRLDSLDMEEGFPGNITVSVTFILTAENQLKIFYEAFSDEDTPFTITNHTYFNLSGFETSIESHTVSIKASKKLEMDTTGACNGNIINLEGAVDDLRVTKTIGEVHQAMNEGFEHYYIFDKNNFELESVATITSKVGKLKMEIATTEPGVLFYTGKYTSDELMRENGQQFGKYQGLCFETHRYPNGPNIDSPKSILKGKEKFESTTIFSFESLD